VTHGALSAAHESLFLAIAANASQAPRAPAPFLESARGRPRSGEWSGGRLRVVPGPACREPGTSTIPTPGGAHGSCLPTPGWTATTSSTPRAPPSRISPSPRTTTATSRLPTS